MHLRVFRSSLFALSTLFLSPWASATDLNEFVIVGADFSSVGSQPTPWTLTAGDNSLIGQASVADFDFLRVTVPANHTLDAIVVTFHEDVNQVYAACKRARRGRPDQASRSILRNCWAGRIFRRTRITATRERTSSTTSE